MDKQYLQLNRVGRALVRRADRVALFALVAANCAVSILVSPQGNFPVNDDWAYARSVQWFLIEGRVRIPDWAAMNLLPQASDVMR